MISKWEKVDYIRIELLLTQEQVDKLYELTRSCNDFNDLATSLYPLRKFSYQTDIDQYKRISFSEDIPF